MTVNQYDFGFYDFEGASGFWTASGMDEIIPG